MIKLREMDAIFFDFGGTLDTNGIHWSEKFWEVYQKFNIPINYGEFREAYVYAEPNVQKYIRKTDNLFFTLKTQVSLQLNYLSERGISFSKEMHNSVLQITQECYKDVISNITDIKPLLKELKLSYKIGLVSNFYGNIKAVCKDLDIDSYFDVIVDSAELQISKPDPQIFKTAIDIMDVNTERAVVIGDSYDRDIVPAKKLGCKTIWLKRKSWKKQNSSESADFIIHSVIDLEKYLLNKSNKIEKSSRRETC